MRNTDDITSAQKVLALLAAFRHEGQEITVTGIAELLGVHKSTASRLASTLVAAGFLARAPKGKSLRLGQEVTRLGLLAMSAPSLAAIAEDGMKWLARETGETINLGVLDGRDAANIAQVDSVHIVGVGSWTGRTTRLHCVANGKVLLAWGGEHLLRTPLERYTPKTITDADELRKELAAVRARGWAANIGELEEGLHAVAVPVFDSLDNCRAALSVSAPAFRLSVGRMPTVAELCRKAADDIGFRLGRRPFATAARLNS